MRGYSKTIPGCSAFFHSYPASLSCFLKYLLNKKLGLATSYNILPAEIQTEMNGSISPHD
jgi:hypothetical protein